MASNPLETIYLRNRQGLYTLALSVTRRTDSAEDAIHDAFLRLCRQTLPENEQQAAAYVYRAVRNAAIDRVRKSNRTEAHTGDSIYLTPDHESLNPYQLTADAERDQMLRESVEQLDEPSRAVINMKLYGQLTFDQIAQAMNEPLSTVASRYRRALEKIKQSVESLV